MVIFLRPTIAALAAAGAAAAVVGTAVAWLRKGEAEGPPRRSWRELSGPGLR